MHAYRRLLEQVRDHLEKYGVPGWPAQLDQWARELDRLDPAELKAHLVRTQKALGGMGSIGDVVICTEAGHKIANDKSAIKEANETLLALVEALYAEVMQRLATLPS
jgi:hypothetical protein